MAAKTGKKTAPATVVPVKAGTAPLAPVLEFLERHAKAIVLALLVIASVRIAATYAVFNHTFDEPIHIACGLEWLDKGVYTWEPQHPPLSRVFAAIGPYLLGLRGQGTPRVDEHSMAREGLAILYKGDYDKTLAMARLGILPFFWVASIVVFFWARWHFDTATAVIAVFLFTFEPTILAHSGLATTDIAFTAFFCGAFVAGMIWLEEPSMRRAAIFGASMGLTILSKFSVFVFFPAVVAMSLAVFWYLERPAGIGAALRGRAASFGVAVLIACVLIWAGYRFSFGNGLPAPELFQGIKDVSEHNAGGHPGYLLGKYSRFGFWYFYEVVLAVKTPIGLLALLGVGVALVLRRNGPGRRAWVPVAFAAAILVVGAFSKITIGIRHVMPVFAAFSVTAAAGAAHLARMKSVGWKVPAALGAMVVWLAGSSVAAHPDYLPYFNFLAGSSPEKIVVDSDLDWGQDLKRLAVRLKQLNVQEVTFANSMMADFSKHGMPPMVGQMNVTAPNPGWNAVSLTFLKARRMGLFEAYPDVVLWPDRVEPQERVGKGILLWYFAPR